MQRIYLSGPITKGNRSHNFYQASEAQRLLMAAGYAVFNPMLSMMHPDVENIPYEQWMETDLTFIEVCDIVVRLRGESPGADREVKHAKRFGIPVFHWMTELGEPISKLFFIPIPTRERRIPTSDIWVDLPACGLDFFCLKEYPEDVWHDFPH